MAGTGHRPATHGRCWPAPAASARPALGVAIALVGSQAETLVGQRDSMDVEKLTLAVMMTVAMAWMLRRRTRPHPG